MVPALLSSEMSHYSLANTLLDLILCAFPDLIEALFLLAVTWVLASDL